MARGQFLKGSAKSPEAQLSKILANTSEALRRANKRAVANRFFLEKVAKQMVDNVAEKEPEFNDYTGNLVSSYSADIYTQSGGPSIYSKQVRGNIDDYNGKRRASLRKPDGVRHGAALFRKLSRHDMILTRRKKERYYDKNKLAEYRYLKPWEKQTTGGYRGMKYNDIAYRDEGKRLFRRQYEAETGKKFTTRSYILITNKAPYADFVQRGGNKSKHYNVLRGGLGVRSLSQYNTLLKVITMQEIEDALRLPMLTASGNTRTFNAAVREKYGRR